MKESISIFDESFYENVKGISIVGIEKIIEDKEIIDQITNMILDVEHSVSEEDISDYYGTTIVVMVYSDGTSQSISMTSKLILDKGQTYSMDKDICSEIREYFED